MIRWITASMLALALLFGGAWACETSGSDSKPGKNPTPGKAQPQVPNNPEVNNPGPVQGDPGAHDPNPSEAQFSGTWWSETKVKPTIKYRLSATGPEIAVPANAMFVQNHKGGGYMGIWDHDLDVQSGQTISFALFGTASFTSANCVIIHHGQFHSRQENRRNCASSYTIP